MRSKLDFGHNMLATLVIIANAHLFLVLSDLVLNDFRRENHFDWEELCKRTEQSLLSPFWSFCAIHKLTADT